VATGFVQRHTGVLEGTPSGETALLDAHAGKMLVGPPAMRYFIRAAFSPEGTMSKEDAVVLASRTLALLLTVWALAEMANLPSYLQSFLHYADHQILSPADAEYWQYWRHHYLIDLGFVVTKIIGFGLLARWLFKGGPEVADLLLPSVSEEISIQTGSGVPS
jgi:hypothetical protein